MNEINKEALSQLFNESLQGFCNTLNTFSDTQFNQIPFEGSWSAGQVGQHIVLSLSYIRPKVNGVTSITERNPQQHIAALKFMGEDTATQREAMPALIPDGEAKDKNILISQLKTIGQTIENDIQHLDISVTCTEIDFPTLGQLTRVEILSFAAYHIQRHHRQLNKIQNHLSK